MVVRSGLLLSNNVQVWLFGLVCYCQDTEVSKQATYLLLAELNNTPASQTYTPPADDLCNVFDDYGMHTYFSVVLCDHSNFEISFILSN